MVGDFPLNKYSTTDCDVVGLVWICDTQELALAGGKERWSIVWRRRSSVRPIAGRWFLYEIYYRRHRINGCVWVAMDGKVVSHSRYVVFQLAEVAVPRAPFLEILGRIGQLRASPELARAGLPALLGKSWQVMANP